MKKIFLVFVMMTLVIGVVVFYDQVLAIFKGMTVLESLKFIYQYILHVVVVTICMFLLYNLPEIFMPWVKWMKATFRMKRRAVRHNRIAQSIQKQKSPRMNADMLLRAYVLQQMSPKTGRGNPAPTQQDDIHIEF
jgi:hypothetical protein